jgi:histidyl-tRNA synthetase
VDTITAITRLNDRKNKMSDEDYRAKLMEIVIDEKEADAVINLISDDSGENAVKEGLKELGITNVRIDRTLARGFDYYTGTVFEILDKNDANNRSLVGGGRYDDLTGMFGGEPVPGVGFGMGDVAMRDFLETHKLLPEHSKTASAMIAVIPVSSNENLYAEKVAMQIRQTGLSVTADIGTQKPDKKKARAQERGSTFIIEIGEEQVKTENITLKNLKKGSEKTCHISDLLNYLGPTK